MNEWKNEICANTWSWCNFVELSWNKSKLGIVKVEHVKDNGLKISHIFMCFVRQTCLWRCTFSNLFSIHLPVGRLVNFSSFEIVNNLHVQYLHSKCELQSKLAAIPSYRSLTTNVTTGEKLITNIELYVSSFYKVIILRN